MLHRRVRLLLDPDCRVEPNASGRWKLGAACLGLLGTLLLSTVTLRPGLATAQEMKAPSNQGHSREVASLALEAPGDSLEYAGRVLGPDGKPFAGLVCTWLISEKTGNRKPASGPPAMPRDGSGSSSRKQISSLETSHGSTPRWSHRPTVSVRDGRVRPTKTRKDRSRIPSISQFVSRPTISRSRVGWSTRRAGRTRCHDPARRDF